MATPNLSTSSDLIKTSSTLAVRECAYCGETFQTSLSWQIYCNEDCRYKRYHNGHSKPQQPIRAKCPTSPCRARRWPNWKHPRLKARIHRGILPISSPIRKKTILQKNLTNFNDLMFLNEHDFHEWFNLNFAIFGIRRLVKTDRFFPDIRAELFNGKYLDIELEYHARNFQAHKHDGMECDLVIAFLKSPRQSDVCGVPVIAIYDVPSFRANGDFDYESRILTPYFQELVTECNSMIARFLKTTRRSITIQKKQKPLQQPHLFD